jgi:hypothetical protein
MGFTVIIDMRGNSSWTTVKPILKVILYSPFTITRVADPHSFDTDPDSAF